MTSVSSADRVRPQDDLFRAVNEEWLDATDIPADRASFGAFHELADAAELACREIVEDAAAQAAAGAAAPGSPEQLIGDLYASFLDTERVEAAGAAPIARRLARVDDAVDAESLLRLTGALRRDGIGGLLGIDVSTDADAPDEYVAYLYQSGLGLPDESYYSDDQYASVREAYATHICAMFDLAGIADSATAGAQVLALETEIAAAHWDRVRCRDRSQTHNPMGRTELNTLLPTAWWDAFTDGLAAPAGLLDHAEVMQPDFFSAMAGLLTADRLPRWRTWVRWKIVHALAPYCSVELVEENFAFYGRTLSGTPELRPRWKRGISLVEGAVGEALGRIYVQKHFRPVAKERMDVLVGNLIEAYRRSITDLSWMTPATKELALEKLSAFRPKVGHPIQFRDYAGLRIERDDLVGNVCRSEAAELDRDLAKVGTPVDREEWLMTPQTVNAYYHPGMNEIVFPAAILQPPYFDADADDATNYGGIGAVIGHEIGHGFDDQGSKYDGTGALRDWWTPADRSAFDELTGRLIEQYSQLSPDGADGQPVNGALTIGENIGDLGGLGIAYQAWVVSLDGVQPDLDRQRELFTSWARGWRTKTRPQEVVRRLAIDPHSPPEFRANQVVRNLDEFHAAFQVTADDGLWLDPADRVRIW